jgi:hypothetical protein
MSILDKEKIKNYLHADEHDKLIYPSGMQIRQQFKTFIVCLTGVLDVCIDHHESAISFRYFDTESFPDVSEKYKNFDNEWHRQKKKK